MAEHVVFRPQHKKKAAGAAERTEEEVEKAVSYYEPKGHRRARGT